MNDELKGREENLDDREKKLADKEKELDTKRVALKQWFDMEKARLCNENKSLKETIVELQIENSRLKEKVKELESNVEDEEKALIKRAAELMDLIDGRINLIANSKAVFERQKKLKLSGEESPRFKRDIDTDTLVNMYVASGYKLTHDILQYYKERGIKITYDGLRKRLINAKVWKQGQ